MKQLMQKWGKQNKTGRIGCIGVLSVLLLLAVFLQPTVRLRELTWADAAQTDADAADEKPLQIVATIFPEYNWTEEILGENPAGAQVRLLAGKGLDLHSYQPSVDDMLLIASCDVFIYVGGESDKWVADALKGESNPDRIVVNLMDVLGENTREEELIEGMQAVPDQEDEAGEKEYDEHVWLSVKNAATFCNAITEALCSADPADADLYRHNLKAYTDKLTALDVSYEEAVRESAGKTLLFGDRFPFRYLTEDYGLSYYAAFAGCSAETEASFETIIFLSEKLDELSLPCVLIIDGSDERLARTIIQNTKQKDQKVLVLNSMQSVTEEDLKNGENYLSVMEENLAVLREALS